MTIYSHSRLSCFEQCPFKFKLKYIDKIIPEIEGSIEAHLGKAVHDTLEWLYNSVKDLPEGSDNVPTVAGVIEYYANKWEETFTDKIKIVRQNLTPKDYFNKGVQFLIDYYLKHKPFRDGTIECEKKIMLDLDSDGKYKIQGFIDRLVQNLHSGHLEVHDYKTANMLPTQEKMDADRQLALYSIAVKEIFGKDKEVKLIWHYLAHNTKIISTRTNAQLDQLKEDTLELIRKIEATTKFPTNKSVLCNWCEYKSMCLEFGGKINERQQKIGTFTKDAVEKQELGDNELLKEDELDIW